MARLLSRSWLRVCAATLAICLGNLLPTPAAFAASDATATARYVGEKRCIECHDTENNHFGHTLHAKVFRQNPRNEREQQVCEACHGPG
jgi:hypothetical protein